MRQKTPKPYRTTRIWECTIRNVKAVTGKMAQGETMVAYLDRLVRADAARQKIKLPK